MSEKSKQKKNQSKTDKSQVDSKKTNKKDGNKAMTNKKESKEPTKEQQSQKNEPIKQHNTTTDARVVKESDTGDNSSRQEKFGDDVLLISQKPNSKYAKREIKSNWTKYDLPEDNYETVEEQDQYGANFKDLLQMPISMGGHFQFKHEKSWGENRKISEYNDMFVLDNKYLSAAISCVPFYERNRIEQRLFSEQQIKVMDSTAARNKEQFEKNNHYINIDSEISKTLSNTKIDVLPKIANHEISVSKTSQLSKKIALPKVKQETIVTKDIEFDVDAELNDMLNQKMDIGESKNTEKVAESILSKDNFNPKTNTDPGDSESNNPSGANKVDLDQWLDDFLDD